MSEWVMYLIEARAGKFTYVGITNNLPRRLRQHNGEIKGGAKATRGKGPWRLVCYVSGLPSTQAVRQLEWRMHHPPRGAPRGRGLPWRVAALSHVLRMERWTSASPLCSTFRPCVHWRDAGQAREELEAYCEQVIEAGIITKAKSKAKTAEAATQAATPPK